MVFQSDIIAVKEQIVSDIKFITTGRYLLTIVRCICEIRFSPSECQERV